MKNKMKKQPQNKLDPLSGQFTPIARENTNQELTFNILRVAYAELKRRNNILLTENAKLRDENEKLKANGNNSY